MQISKQQFDKHLLSCMQGYGYLIVEFMSAITFIKHNVLFIVKSPNSHFNLFEKSEAVVLSDLVAIIFQQYHCVFFHRIIF